MVLIDHLITMAIHDLSHQIRVLLTLDTSVVSDNCCIVYCFTSLKHHCILSEYPPEYSLIILNTICLSVPKHC